jgi:hypothetical protein
MHPSWFYCCLFANCDPTRLSAPDDWSLVFPFQLFAYLGRGNELLWLVGCGRLSANCRALHLRALGLERFQLGKIWCYSTIIVNVLLQHCTFSN